MSWFSTVSSTDAIYGALSSLQGQKEALAYSALNRGAVRIGEQKYDLALAEFRRAAAFKPDLVEARLYMGRTLGLLGRVDEAIAEYRTAVRVSQGSTEARTELASFCITNGRYAEAEAELLQVTATNPLLAGPVASLGHIYLATDRVAEAETQFAKAARLAPSDPASHYSLGLVYNRQGRYSEAAQEFSRAIEMKPGYAAAHADLAYSYIGLGETDSARGEVATLLSLNTEEGNELATEVELALYTPKILFEDIIASTFRAGYGPGTTLEKLDAGLAEPFAARTFTMVLQFNQPMDIGSVQNVFNWSISRASGDGGGVYNNGATLSSQSEATILPFPSAVSYDPGTYQATVYFRISQNASGTAVLDPSHVVFRFKGTDVGGNPMDPAGDEYDRSAGEAF